MPGMPVFQTSPSQLRGQIFVQNSVSDAVEALKVDGSGNLLVTGSVGLASGSEVGLATGSEVALVAGTQVGLSSGSEVALAAGTQVGLSSGSEVALVTGTQVGLVTGTEVALSTGSEVALAAGSEVALAAGSEVALAAGSEVALAAGSEVALAAGSEVIGKVETQLVYTNTDAFGEETPLTSKAIPASGGPVLADSQDISLESSYNWFIKNTGTDSSNQDITVKVEISPDGTNWVEDTGESIVVAYNTAAMITVTNFLRYVRYTVTPGTDDTTVISCFQAQH